MEEVEVEEEEEEVVEEEEEEEGGGGGGGGGSVQVKQGLAEVALNMFFVLVCFLFQ